VLLIPNTVSQTLQLLTGNLLGFKTSSDISLTFCINIFPMLFGLGDIVSHSEYPFWTLLVCIVHRARLFTKLYHLSEGIVGCVADELPAF
jgi:hypothetical protein